jgi:stage III sporulation protein AA
MLTASAIGQALPYFPPVIRDPLLRLPEDTRAQIQEIRLRIGRQLHVTVHGTEFVLTPGGTLADEPAPGITVGRALMDTVFQSICSHSLHAVQYMLQKGFVTIAGGSRAGIAGTAVIQSGAVTNIRAVSGINLRIASARPGAAGALLTRLNTMGITGGVLLTGPPASGKTTLLRDLARTLGADRRVCIIDERGELAAVQNGEPQFDIGTQTDVIDGCPKAEGIAAAVRVLTPDILICDELGGSAETEALLDSLHTGVRLFASAHAASLRTLGNRPQLARLIAAGVFEAAVLLGTEDRIGQMLAVQRLNGGMP